MFILSGFDFLMLPQASHALRRYQCSHEVSPKTTPLISSYRKEIKINIVNSQFLIITILHQKVHVLIRHRSSQLMNDNFLWHNISSHLVGISPVSDATHHSLWFANDFNQWIIFTAFDAHTMVVIDKNTPF